METDTNPGSMPISTKTSLPGSPIDKDRSQCSLCGRKFLSDRIAKHLEICKKIKEKKRKLFDSTKQRLENGENLENIKPSINSNKSLTNNNINNNNNNNAKTGKRSNWRQQHEEFIKAIRNARGEAVEETGTSDNNDQNLIPYGMTECPTCFRRFSDKSADRHIQWCRDRAQNEQKRKQSASNQEAMERMKARTKYKPTLQPSSRPSSKSISPRRSQAPATTGPSNNARRASTETDNSRANSTNSRLSVATTTATTKTFTTRTGVGKGNTTTKPAAATTTTTTNNRFGPKNLSKSTGNLVRSVSRSTNNSSRASNANHTRLERKQPNNQTIVMRKKSTVQAKVNTGLYGSNGSLPKAEKFSAPIMKFKERFPNHQHQRNNPIDYDILRKNSTYDDSPKTVPGVRTGGISPTKSDSRMSKSEYASNQIDNIKKRIDMYISGIYDNDLLQRFGNTKQQFVDDYDGRGTVNIERSASVHSAISARGSTSDSSDSGLGSHLQPQDKDSNNNNEVGVVSNNISNSNHSSSNTNKRTEIFSPSMSELEGNLKLDIRNGSLNDIHHLLEQKDGDVLVTGQTDLTPRFCHTCGTKYPNALAKFCYECGSKRFPAAFQ